MSAVTAKILALLILCALCVFTAANRDCGGVYTENEVVIASPKLPRGTEENFTCEFTFIDEKCSTEFVFRFLDFDLGDAPNCRDGGLEIHDQGMLCNKQVDSKVYYSQNGTLKVKYFSGIHQQDGGFKILVTKTPCSPNSVGKYVKRSAFHQTCSTFEVPTLSQFSVMKVKPFYYYYHPHNQPLINLQNNNDNFCCADRYHQKHFIISSPKFPHTKNNPIECIYRIYKTSPNVCRLRLNFLFFWNGYQAESGCQYGYLRIDGKDICGCRIGLKLTSSFIGDSPKVIEYKSVGHPSVAFSGFAIEVIQDECSTKYSASSFVYAKPVYHYRIRRWPHQNNLVFNMPNYFPTYQSDNYVGDRTSDKEDTVYISTFNFNPLHHYVFDDRACKAWGLAEWAVLAKKTLWQSMSKCVKKSSTCVEIRNTAGCLKSPGYPFYYPNNLKLCYRFVKAPGYCSLKLIMLDFLIQESYYCTRDYFLLGGKRYCGSRLYNTYSNLTFVNGTYEDVLFETDGSISCRGFKAWYQQIPCRDTTPSTTPWTTTPITSTTIRTTTPIITIPPTTTPPTTTLPPTTTMQITTLPPTTTTSSTVPPTTTIRTTTLPPTTTSSTIPPTTTIQTTTLPPTTTTVAPTTTLSPLTTTPQECYKEYNTERFQIEHYGYEGNLCIFIIFKYRPEVCWLNLRFIVFDLDCQEEYLMIDGTKYCGPINSITLNFEADTITIFYNRVDTSSDLNLRLRILGTQSDENCIPDPEVNPGERALTSPKFETYTVKKQSGVFDVTFKNLNREMCGLIIRLLEWHDEQICDILSNFEQRKHCITVEENALYAPYIDDEIKLTLPSEDVYNSARFKEVRCGTSVNDAID